MLFTIILANRINEETQKKLQAEERLCYQRANYTQKLEQEVFERTQKVNQLLKEKEALLKEVYHRVVLLFNFFLYIFSFLLFLI